MGPQRTGCNSAIEHTHTDLNTYVDFQNLNGGENGPVPRSSWKSRKEEGEKETEVKVSF